MQNEEQPVAKRKQPDLVEYTCRRCGGYDLEGVFYAFLPLVDHLIQHLCLEQIRELSQPFHGANDEVWYRNPDTFEIIPGLPEYDPDSLAWKKFLTKGEKLLPQTKTFLPDIADWLEKALDSIEPLNSIALSDVLVAELLIKLSRELTPEFQEQREYLLKSEEKLKGVGMDSKWLKRRGRQARFVAEIYGGLAMEPYSVNLSRIRSPDKTQCAWSDTPDPQDQARTLLVGATRVDRSRGLGHLQLSVIAGPLARSRCVPKSRLHLLTRPSAQL